MKESKRTDKKNDCCGSSISNCGNNSYYPDIQKNL